MTSLNIARQLRFISTGARLQASTMQFGRIINKVMRSDRTKKDHDESVYFPTLPSTVNNRSDKMTNRKNRRVTVLNKVFMKYITDLMATGEVASKLVNRGIEISHVNVAQDYSVVNVYWFAQNNGNVDESVEQILKVSAGHLQHELSQLRVIGMVPPINFIKNKQYSVMKDVEDLLAKVDFGEDYTPTAYIPSSKVPILETTLSEDLRARISQIDNVNCTNDDIETYKLEIPEMRQDVMGFDHSSIMNKIKIAVSKSSKTEQNVDSSIKREPKGNAETTSQEVIDFLSSKEQNHLFKEFLKKRRIEEKRKLRSVTLFEAKLQEEMEWVERMQNEHNNQEDIDIDESYRDDYNDSRSK